MKRLVAAFIGFAIFMFGTQAASLAGPLWMVIGGVVFAIACSGLKDLDK